MSKALSYLKTLTQRIHEDECLTRASALVYTTLLAMVPLAIVTVYVLSLFPFFQGVAKQLEHFIYANFFADSAQQIYAAIKNTVMVVRSISDKSLIVLLLTSTLVINTMANAFNKIWHTEPRHNIVVRFLVYLVFLIVAPIFIGGGMILTSYVMSLPLISEVDQVPLLNQAWVMLIPYVLTFILFTGLNAFLPSTKVSIRAALLGGLVTTVLFELLKWGFGLYLRYVATYQVIYGALAIVPVFLLWLYLVWVVILVGALVANLSGRPGPVLSH